MDLIIGAGISGLSYANFIENDFFIVEKESEPGGYCKTIKRNGFVWDYSGHFFHFQHPELEKYICKNISASSLLSVEKHTQIYYKGKYIDFPFQKNIHQLEKEELIECLYDLFTAGKHSYSTFKEMVYANLGKSIAEKFLIPYNEKLYACDLDVLDVNAMGRFFPKADKEDIILNFQNNGLPLCLNEIIYEDGTSACHLKDIISDTSLVVRLSQSNCGICVNTLMSLLQKVNMKNVIFLTDYEDQCFLDDLKLYRIKGAFLK